MSSYGSPGGPPPGQPQDPWQGSGDQSNVPYQWRPLDEGEDPALPPWQPPSYNDGEGVVWSPTPDPPRRRRGLLVALVVVVLLAGAGGAYYYFAGRSADPTGQTATKNPSRQPAQPAPATTREPTAAPSVSAGGSSADVFSAQVGDCLANEGTDSAPKMYRSACVPGTYQVLKRLPGTIDKDQCNGVTGYTHNYFYDSTANDKDFVLCLKQR